VYLGDGTVENVSLAYDLMEIGCLDEFNGEAVLSIHTYMITVSILSEYIFKYTQCHICVKSVKEETNLITDQWCRLGWIWGIYNEGKGQGMQSVLIL